jgi:hypothetical protein
VWVHLESFGQLADSGGSRLALVDALQRPIWSRCILEAFASSSLQFALPRPNRLRTLPASGAVLAHNTRGDMSIFSPAAWSYRGGYAELRDNGVLRSSP